MKTIEYNSLVLAFLGDSIYEGYIREYLIKTGISHVKELQEKSLEYVSAKSQAKILKKLLTENFFSEIELDIIRRARNTKSNSHPKNCDVLTYQHATAIEALIGYLKLENNIERIEEIINKIIY